MCLKTVSWATNTHGWGRYPGNKGESGRTSETTEGYTRGTDHHHHKRGPSTGPAADLAVAVRMWGYSSLPQGTKS